MTAPAPRFGRLVYGVRLAGEDGNAFAIMARVTRAMRGQAFSPTEIDQYRAAAMSGDYDHLLRVTMAVCATYDEDQEDE